VSGTLTVPSSNSRFRSSSNGLLVHADLMIFLPKLQGALNKRFTSLARVPRAKPRQDLAVLLAGGQKLFVGVRISMQQNKGKKAKSNSFQCELQIWVSRQIPNLTVESQVALSKGGKNKLLRRRPQARDIFFQCFRNL